ncbi:MAG: hypothetical protein ABIH00_03725 [Armatimonadota bacterium]
MINVTSMKPVFFNAGEVKDKKVTTGEALYLGSMKLYYNVLALETELVELYRYLGSDEASQKIVQKLYQDTAYFKKETVKICRYFGKNRPPIDTVNEDNMKSGVKGEVEVKTMPSSIYKKIVDIRNNVKELYGDYRGLHYGLMRAGDCSELNDIDKKHCKIFYKNIGKVLNKIYEKGEAGTTMYKLAELEKKYSR